VKHLILTLVAMLSLSVHAKEDLMLVQNSDARSGFSLDGQWNVIVDPYENGFYNHRYQEHSNGYFKNANAKQPLDLIEYDFSRSQKLQVPGDWNSQDEKLFLYEGTVWYQKDFALNKLKNKRYLIHFGAVNYQAIVYVNGEKVGSHEGGFTAFQFDITEQLISGDNFVVVKVDNRRERDQIPTVNTDWWNYGGITRSVKILELEQHYVADYFVEYLDEGRIQGWVQLNAELKNESVDVSIAELGLRQTLVTDGKGRANFSFSAKPSLWSPESPKRYELQIDYSSTTVKDLIGFRSVAVDGQDILLNGKPIFLKGISLHEETPFGDGRAWSEEEARTLLTWAKQLSCNFVRLAHYPHNENMLKVADELGLLVWSEIPVYWTILFEEEYVYQKAEKQLAEMISRDKNRASIILWSVANETPIHKARYTFLQRLVKTARKLDDSRLITAAMDTQSTTEFGKRIDDPFAKEIDVIGINTYCGWYSDKIEDCSKFKWESPYNKPIIISEFGAGALQGYNGSDQQRFTEEHQALIYEHNLAMLDNMEALRGVTPWILKDFRSPRRPLPGIQDFWNRKGLISENGQRKQAWYVLRDWYLTKQ
jgi:beta-glucuronidase